MSKKHDAVFDDVLSDLETKSAPQGRAGTRFLKRSTSIGEQLAGQREEKTLQWVDPAACRMWERHNRAYELLTPENCRDLIDGIRAQGRQEFPAIVRRLTGEDHQFEVICGARRHFAVSWLRANNYPRFRYLVEVRDLNDEEAFRLADIENRDRDDISDFERARDYASAIALYYGGKQKAMAARLEVSEGWLSRYLGLAKLPDEVVAAFASIRDIRELHARTLKPFLATPKSRAAVLAEAGLLAAEQAGQGGPVEAPKVIARLKAVAVPPRASKVAEKIYRRTIEENGIKARRLGRKTVLEVPDSMSRADVEAALEMFLKERFGQR